LFKNRRTGQVYADKAAFDADVANPATDTTIDDFQQDLEITVASVTTKSDTSYNNNESFRWYRASVCSIT
jgi:hypothetical protein